MMVDPFPRDTSRPLVVHVRTHVLSNRKAPFLRQTILGLRPYFRNVVLTPEIDCPVPADVSVERVPLATLRDPVTRLHYVHRLKETYGDVDLVLGHMGNGARIGAPLAELLNAPLLAIFGGSDVNVEFDKPVYREVYRELVRTPCARFLTVADYLREKLIDRGVAPDRVFTWHRGSDLSRSLVATHAPRTDGAPVQAAVSGRLLEVKGHEYAVRALGILRTRGVALTLNLFGDGPLRSHLESLARQLDVVESVRFHGHLRHTEIIERLQEQDIYVHPSVTCGEGRVEGVPNAIMEAHAAGLPVVASNSGGIREAVVDGVSGYLVPERDPAALAEKLELLAGNRAARAQMGARGRAHVEVEFSLETQSRRLAAHAIHVIRQGELFEARGWSKHSVSWRDAVSSREPADNTADLQTRLVSAAGRARYASSIPVVGPLIDVVRKVAYTSLVKPYLRAFAGELRGFLLEAQSSASRRNEPNPILQAPLHGSAKAPEVQMSRAACAACPHTPPGSRWPDAPCPMDDGCREALEWEFRARTPAATPKSSGTVVDVATLQSDGKLPFTDRSVSTAQVSAAITEIGNLDLLMNELARVLSNDGRVFLELSWSPQSTGVPFSELMFGSSTDSPQSAKAGSWNGREHTAAILEAAGRAGLQRSTPEVGSSIEEPCPLDFQARFAGVLRELGASREQAARALCTVLTKISAGAD